ncbi:MAG: hypothetical protein ACOC12_07425 [Bacteroidota bacterium]
MNKHIFTDNLTASLGALVSQSNKFFAADLHSPSFTDLIIGTEINLPQINRETTLEVTAHTPVGAMNTAIRIEKWLGPGYKTIIYHHGNNERPFDYGWGAKNTFYNILAKAKKDFPANLMVVRAPFHDLPIRKYQKKMTSLANFMAMLSVSVKMNECIISRLQEANASPVITAGISLGGWVTNLHRSFFNSSDLYAPLLAGTLLAELFLISKYSKLVAPMALQHAETLREKLNFQKDYQRRTSNNVAPLLARHDQFIQYDVQRNAYDGFPLTVLEAGHITGALKTAALRNHMLKLLQ